MTLSAPDINLFIDRRLSNRRVLGLIMLAGAGLLQSTLLGVMLATEPEPLPNQTTAALGLVIVAGLSWVLFAVWRLTRRVPLFLADRVVSSAMATTFSLVATGGGLAIALHRGSSDAALTVLAVGISTIGWAASLLYRTVAAYRQARSRLADLNANEPTD